MDRMIRSNRAHTVPVKLHIEADPKAGLIRELERYQKRLDTAHRVLKHQRAVGHGPMRKAEAEGRLDIGATAGAVITDIMTDDDCALVLHWEYVAKKLQAAVGVLDVDRDMELAGLRSFMKGLKLT